MPLETLAPQFDEKAHRFYLSQLESALQNPRNKNVALSGSYGVGKSSVLDKFVLDHASEVVEISFSGFRPDIQKRPATTEGETINPAANTPTNQIQKEIVKQLIYRESPTKTPASKYRRPETLQPRRELALALMIGALGSLISYLTGFLDRPIQSFTKVPGAPVSVAVATAVVISLLVLGLRVLLHNRVIIEKLSAGPATIALSPQATTFFDEYLDEIVYVFQVSGRRLVVFEDLDRFDDQGIFQALGALNTLLNRSAQLKKKPIVFIYAVRDSIFTDGGGADDAATRMVERADRTKFFDLIIPMVPFVSPKNARDLMMPEIAKRGFKISAELVDLAAQHVADMRLMLNILNEFGIFDEILIGERHGAPGLTADKLFALVLYKNVHLEDFERVRLGTSELDGLYDEYRRVVEAATTRTVRRARKREIDRVQAERRSETAEQLGNSLFAYVGVTARSLGHPATWTNTYEFDGASMREDQIYGLDTWTRVAAEDLGIAITLGQGQRDVELSLSADDLRSITRNPLLAADWSTASDEQLRRLRDEAAAEAEQVAHLTMEQLYSRTDLTVPRGSDENGESVNFAQIVESKLKSRLARSLVREGYLDEYFAIYAAQFHGERVNDAAQNFIMRHVDRGLPDALYPLKPAEAAAIVRERPELVNEPAVLNVAIVDYLLASNLDVSPVVTRLGDNSSVSKGFLQLYLGGASGRFKLASLLGNTWAGFIPFVVAELETDENSRRELVNASGQSLGPVVPSDPTIGRYLEANAAQLLFLTSEGASDPDAVGVLLRSVGARLPQLDQLAGTVRAKVIQDGTFELNRANLQVATGSRDIGLEVLSAVPSVYQIAISNVDAYLAIVGERRSGSVAIKQEATLVQVLRDLPNRNDVQSIVSAASPTIKLRDLGQVPSDSWEPLATAKLVAPTATNAYAFVSERGALGDGMAKVIRGRRTIEEPSQLTATQRHDLALAVLEAHPISPEERARIAKKVLGSSQLDADEVPLETGNLIGCLIRRSVVADDSAIFELTKALGWPTREAVIVNSKAFTTYVSPAVLTPIEVRQMLQSGSVGSMKKAAVLTDVAAYTKGMPAGSLWLVARTAYERKRAMPTVEILALASRGMDPTWTLVALSIGLSNRTLTDVTAVLSALGGKYAEVGLPNKRPTLPNDQWHQGVMDFLVAQGHIKARQDAWFNKDKMTVLPL